MIPARPAGVDAEAWAALFGPPVAHRGLWSGGAGSGDVPENTLAAFAAAADAGYGMELDVQLSADDQVVVFHDDRLERLTEGSGRVADRTAAELAALALAGSDQTIPRLADVLGIVGGRALVLIELKVLGGDEGRLESRVAEALDDYEGPVGILSFNPRALAWFAEHQPQVMRGLNSMAYHDAANWMFTADDRQALAELDHVGSAQPHFLSLGLDMLPSPAADTLRSWGLPVIAWTVRTPGQWARVADGCDNLIFEGFRPEAPTRVSA